MPGGIEARRRRRHPQGVSRPDERVCDGDKGDRLVELSVLGSGSAARTGERGVHWDDCGVGADSAYRVGGKESGAGG